MRLSLAGRVMRELPTGNISARLLRASDAMLLIIKVLRIQIIFLQVFLQIAFNVTKLRHQGGEAISIIHLLRSP